jgi:hypothetical protein
MFGESDSESPRVPSPWDSLISTPPSSSPPNRSQNTPSPLSVELIPRLVPEADEGNVEYKLQLLAPSPARFARLVTQLKWRLLEGGGQAYYELGVADSGALVGLPRAELEQSLETLEMMAGEIGASVIVVKEIEVPAAMAGIAAAQTDKWNGKRRRKAMADDGSSESSTAVNGNSTTTETEAEHSTDIDFEDDLEDMSLTLMLNNSNSLVRRYSHSHSSGSFGSLFSMDPDLDPDPANNADTEPDDDPAPPAAMPTFSADLEIMSVFKPRPMQVRMHTHNHVIGPTKMKRIKKLKHLPQMQNALVNDASAVGDVDQKHDDGYQAHHRHGDEAEYGKRHQHHSTTKSSHRRQMRERKRAEKRKALVAYATGNTTECNEIPLLPQDVDVDRVGLEVLKPTLVETDKLVQGLEALHVSLDLEVDEVDSKVDVPTVHVLMADDENGEGEDDDDDDVFASPTVATSYASFTGGNTSATYLSASSAVDVENGVQGDGAGHNRLIVEALVVRKMSLDEAFLDFGGFALM